MNLQTIGRTRQRGVAAVELAFLAILLLLMAAGTFEFGRAFWHYNALAKATRDGARVMSMVQKDTLGSSVPNVQTQVASAANQAKLYPPLVEANVDVACDSGSGFAACVNVTGTNPSPAHVRVAITGYTIDIGGVFPFFNPGTYGVSKFSDVPLAPHTTMRYMN